MFQKSVLAVISFLVNADDLGTTPLFVSGSPTPFQDIPFYYVLGDPFKDVAAEHDRRIKEKEGLQSYAFHTMSVAGEYLEYLYIQLQNFTSKSLKSVW